MDILKSSLKDISAAIKSKKISATEAVEFYLKRAGLHNSKINAYITMNEHALAQAKEIDVKLSKGEDLSNKKLLGIPFGIKDMLCTKGIKTTAASKILENFVPPYDATVVSRIKSNGGIVLGKLNQDEFAMGSSNETSTHGLCRNPWDLERVPGGSSGGSAAAQAAGLAAATIGTDTGGSIRQPASYCGIVGVKPTYGRVSRYGIIAYASSLDQAGPMVNSVEDAALVLESICGFDEMDSTTSQRSDTQFSQNINKSIKGTKIGVLKEFFSDQLDMDVKKSLELAIDNLKKLGAEIVEVSIPLTAHAVPIYYLIAASEASSNLSRYDGVKYGYRYDFKDLSSVSLDSFYSKTRGHGFGSEVKRRIIMGTYCLSSGYYEAYYGKASQVRRLLKNQFSEVFKSCDALISPVSTTPAFKLGERIDDALAMYLNDIFTVSTNLVGIPGMSLPYSLSQKNLPIGVQLMCRDFDEQKMLNIAAALEETSPVRGAFPKGFV
ncbi:MAG: Asp-tRNA(Asn)/Glu-tRNA(Gln) amidotransferase subunit GatA [Bdellovibrionaceae bacterium]|nr:Asp-tRNA(Asn)/Glu-tRNA(Gln) amidotransferase subunit GatA [Pseudobdellovibrionaceae bacterium]